jgi:hypothetical protein
MKPAAAVCLAPPAEELDEDAPLPLPLPPEDVAFGAVLEIVELPTVVTKVEEPEETVLTIGSVEMAEPLSALPAP